MRDYRGKPYRPYANQREWRPAMALSIYDRPEVGMLIGREHVVWRVTEIKSKSSEKSAAYTVVAEHAGGTLPEQWGDRKTGYMSVPASGFAHWHVYVDGRWPQCSCCGEPMPCRATIQDDQVGAALDKVEELDSRMPGCCWACGDPISQRQQSIRYVGENLDHPGGIPVVFHLRADCRHVARKYEEKWLAANPERRRILTYPKCGGTLVIHKGGTDECVGGGRDPECLGGISHNHSVETVCYGRGETCTRGCPCPRTRDEMWSCGGGPRRPKLRDPGLPQGHPERPAPRGDVHDGRATCPGMLVGHEDGTSECTAGGLDDCWDGSKYRHDRKKSCQNLSHGCPKCETGETL